MLQTRGTFMFFPSKSIHSLYSQSKIVDVFGWKRTRASDICGYYSALYQVKVASTTQGIKMLFELLDRFLQMTKVRPRPFSSKFRSENNPLLSYI